MVTIGWRGTSSTSRTTLLAAQQLARLRERSEGGRNLLHVVARLVLAHGCAGFVREQVDQACLRSFNLRRDHGLLADPRPRRGRRKPGLRRGAALAHHKTRFSMM